MAVEPLVAGFWRVTVHFGFMDTPDVPKALSLCERARAGIIPFETSYFLSRETVVPTPGCRHGALARAPVRGDGRNAGSVAEFFRLPDNAVVELGTRVQI